MKKKTPNKRKQRPRTKKEGGERWVVYELPKERSAVADRHSLICHYSHQAAGSATLALCTHVCVFVRAASLIGILVAGRGKAESPWRPGTKEERRGERGLGGRGDSKARRGQRKERRVQRQIEVRAQSNEMVTPTVFGPFCEQVLHRAEHLIL